MQYFNRREFLGSTAAAAGGLAYAMHVSESRAADKDKKPFRLAVMGVNGRGEALVSEFSSFPEAEIAYICDPDDETIGPALKAIRPGAAGGTPKTVRDFRVALDDPSVDALVCAAPDHWHALATILACQAGKDVYVEKPTCHNIREGRMMVEAARRHNRVVQVGTQRRSAAHYQAAVNAIREGQLGKVHFARAWIASVRPNIGHCAVSQPSGNLDFDLWCGPAANDGYKKNLVHYHWHWRWAYGTGECGNNGVHNLDVARWGMGIEAPMRITCAGDKYSFDDDQETPDTQLATFEFPGGCIHWEHRTWNKRGIDDMDGAVIFYGTDGDLVLDEKGWRIFRNGKVEAKHEGSEKEYAHLRNFLDCLTTREKPNADIEIGHRSTSLCLLANIAWRTRSVIEFDAATEQIPGIAKAAALLGREEQRKGYELPSSV